MFILNSFMDRIVLLIIYEQLSDELYECNATQFENNRPVVAAFAPSGGVKAKVALQAKNTLTTLIIVTRFACKARGTRGRTNATCTFYIFGLLTLRCYIYICICSDGGYETSISKCIAPKVLMYSFSNKILSFFFYRMNSSFS